MLGATVAEILMETAGQDGVGAGQDPHNGLPQ